MTQIENKGQFLDRNTLQFKRNLKTSVDKAWRALTVKSEIAHWFMPADIDLKVGGHFEFFGGWVGWIGEYAPFSHIQFNTSKHSFTRFEIKDATTFGVELILTDKLRPETSLPEDMPTIKGIADHITQNQPGGQGTHWTGMIAGWHRYLDALDTHLTGLPPTYTLKDLCYAYNQLLKEYWK